MSQKIALITGASSGIGRATATRLAQAKYNLILLDVAEAPLKEVAQNLAKKFKIKVLSEALDVRDRARINTVIDSLPKPWQKIDVLVNCAGVALSRSPLHEGDPADWDIMIDINIKGMLYIFRAVVPLMIKQNSGHIINIGSITGKETYPAGSVYSITKHATIAMSNSMRMDLIPFGIKVTTINPGRVATKLSLVRYKGDKERAAGDYQGFEPLQPEDIAETIYFAVTRPKHVNIHDVVVTPAAQAGANYIFKRAP